MNRFVLKGEYITLGQFLKATDHINSGGEAKFFLYTHQCYINDIKTTMRGKKIRATDVVKIDSELYHIENDPKINT